MELSLFLARSWGLFSIIVALAIMLNKKSYMQMIRHLEGETLSILLAGVISLGIGLAQVVGYSSWTFDYRGLITLFGWMALIKGLLIVLLPGYMQRFAKVITNGSWYMILMVVFLIVGLYLTAVGFML